MILSILFILLIMLGIGLPLSLLISKKLNILNSVGIAFPLGIGVFTFIMFISNTAGIRFSFLNEFILLVLLATPLITFSRQRLKTFFINFCNSFRKPVLAPVEKVMLGVMVFLVVTSFINTFYWPVHIWDSLTLYDIRGKIFAATGFMKDAWFYGYYWGYPLLTSLAHTIVYLCGGKYPQFLYSLFYLSLGISLYGTLREFTSRKISMIATLVLLITQPIFYHSLLSLTNLPFTVYLFLGAVYVYLWDKKKHTGYLVLSALFAGLSTWTRSVEPFWLAIFLVVFMVAVYRKKFWDIIIFSIFFFPIHEAWKVFQNFLTSTGTSTVAEIIGYTGTIRTQFDMSRWVQVAVYLYKYIVIPWGAVFIAFILATMSMLILKKYRKLFLIFVLTYTLLGVFVMGTFAFGVGYAGTFASGDAPQRLSMLFYSLFAFCIGLFLQEMIEVKK